MIEVEDHLHRVLIGLSALEVEWRSWVVVAMHSSVVALMQTLAYLASESCQDRWIVYGRGQILRGVPEWP